MAKKGSHSKNGADQNGGKARNKLPGLVDPLPSDMTVKSQPNGEKMLGDEGLLNSNAHEGFLGHLKNDVKGSKSSANSKKNSTVGNASLGEKSEVKTPTSGKATPSSNEMKDMNPAFTLDETNRDFMVSDRHNHISENHHSGIYNGEVVGDQMGEPRPSVKLAIEHLSILALRLRQIASIWVEKQKPLINSFATVVLDARNYMQTKVKHAYPIICSWISHLGKILFLFSMVWLDCSLRGLGSLLHLGTTSFFTIIWCSFLSLFAMIGITKMLMFVVATCLVLVLVGLGVAILMAIMTSAVILWLYGNFWTTMLVIVLAGVAFVLRRERGALFLTTAYSLYCVGCYMGWLGLFMALNLSFISSDILINFLRSNSENQESDIPPEHATSSQGRANHFYKEFDEAFNSASERSVERDSGAPSTSGNPVELTSEDEVMRLLSCTDHYSALGFARYESIDIPSLKREYRKKAMLVHPDKNMGNEKAAEAFKKLQNAYEVLLDSLKRKTYDDELRREEILNYFRRFQNIPRKRRRNGVYGPGFYQDNGSDGFNGEARRIACKKCGDFHIWIQTKRPKSRARWCQDCKDFHHAKDGDGWVEQSFQPLMFGLLNKMDPPHAYVCADSKVYDATEWFICQGMRCPVNSHKPTFHINTSVSSMKHNVKGTHSSGGGVAGGVSGTNTDETMTEEELFEWLQNAMQSGIFDAPGSTTDESPPMKTGSFPKSGSKKKRKGKKAR